MAVEIITVSIVFFAFMSVIAGVKVVGQSDIYVIERLGKFNRELRAGLHIIIPYIENVANKISTKEEIIDIAKQPVITKDNVTIHVNGLVFVVANDAIKASYNVINYKQSV